jgi:uncharacterized protein YjdB
MKKNYILSIVAYMLFAVSYVSAQTVYEAESVGGNTKTETNASNGSVVYNFTAGAQNKIVTVNGGLTGGSGTVLIRYSNGDATNKTLNFYTYQADGNTPTTPATAVNFPPTGSWTTFAVVAVPKTLPYSAGTPGINNFKVKNDGATTIALEIDNYTVTVGSPYVATTSLAVNATYSSVMVGMLTNVSATVTPSNATNQFIAWSTSDPAVATVSSTGVVTGVGVGTATITATNESTTGTTSINVIAYSNIPVTGVTVSPGTATLISGNTTTLSSTVAPINASNNQVTWSSSNNAIATVSSTGVVTAVSAGQATITATTVNGSFTSTSIITVQAISVTGVTVSPSSATIIAGAYTPLTATIAPTNASNKTVIWSSSNSAVARVSNTGVVTGMSAGSATITATSQDGSFTSTSAITVNTPAANYALNPDFELNGAPAVSATNWFEWSATAGNIDNSSLIAGNVGLGNAVGGTPHSGTYYIAITPTVAKPTTYDVLNKQDLTGLPNGTYTLKAWFRGNGGSGYFNIGGTYINYTMPMAQWTQIVINNVNVTSGTASIQIQYNSTAGTELDIDDVQFTLNQMVLITGINAVTPASKTLSLNETTTLTTTVIPSNASNNVINWTSSNPSVATVSAAGLVTAVAAGTTTITATTAEGGFTSTCAITVLANYVKNPGFELNTAPYSASPTYWYKWGPNAVNGNVVTGNNSLGDAVGGTPHSGTNYLEFAGSGTYEVDCKQDLSGMPNGTYTLTFWCRGNNTNGGYYNIGGAYPGWGVLPSQWTQKTINNVSVTNGTASINFIYTTTSGGTLNIDDVELTLNPGIPTATTLVSKNESISIYPTVIANNVLNISNSVKGNCEVSICNINGQAMYTNKLNSGNVSINTSFLKTGMYLVRVSNGIENSVQKVIVP